MKEKDRLILFENFIEVAKYIKNEDAFIQSLKHLLKDRCFDEFGFRIVYHDSIR